MSITRSGHLEWAVAGRPAEGQTTTGDLVSVQVSGDHCILAVIDGLGHGPKAAAAAKQAIQAIEEDPTRSLTTLLQSAHQNLLQSRGAAATVAVIDGPLGELRWMGVGNVEGVVVHRDEKARPRNHGVFLRGGVLGRELPKLKQPEPVLLQDGDRIAFATDGVRVDLAEAVQRDLAVDRLAKQILADHATPADDAVVLVACYRSRPV